MNYVLAFLAGIFLANGVPHYVKGVTGEYHMTPIGAESHPLINVIWGMINFAIAVWLIFVVEEWSLWGTCLAADAGVVVISLYLAWFWSDEARTLPWH